jgi:hypothetical protein
MAAAGTSNAAKISLAETPPFHPRAPDRIELIALPRYQAA